MKFDMYVKYIYIYIYIISLLFFLKFTFNNKKKKNTYIERNRRVSFQISLEINLL